MKSTLKRISDWSELDQAYLMLYCIQSSALKQHEEGQPDQKADALLKILEELAVPGGLTVDLAKAVDQMKKVVPASKVALFYSRMKNERRQMLKSRKMETNSPVGEGV